MNSFFMFLMFIGQGLGLTLLLLVGSVIPGILIGGALAFARHHQKGIFLIEQWISVVRGTPVMLQLSVVYFISPGLLGVNLGVIGAGILTFGLNSSAYFAEIFRSGIESIPKGQFYAAKSLGIPTFYCWKDIIWPQVLHRVYPAMLNEVVSLTKDTALISILGGMDVMRRAQVLSAEHFIYFLPLCIAAGYYYVLVKGIETLGQKWMKGGYDA